MKNVVWPVFVRAVLPAFLTASGTLAAFVWAEGFRAFCGVS